MTAAKSADIVNYFVCELSHALRGYITHTVPSGPLAHFDPFKTVNLHIFWVTYILILALEKLTGDNCHHIWRMNWWLFYTSFPLCWVQPLNIWTDSSYHFFLRLLCFCFWTTEWVWSWNVLWYPTPLPPSLPSSLRFSCSPVTLISMCPEQYEWVSTQPATSPCLQTGMRLNHTSFPPFSPHLAPLTSQQQLSHDCTACCLSACLSHWLNMQPKHSPAVFLLSPSSPLCSIQLAFSCTSQQRLSKTIQPLRRSSCSPFFLFLGSSDFFSRWCCEGPLGCLWVSVSACACEFLCFNEVAWACRISFISITPFIFRLSQSPQLSHDDTHSRIEQYASRYALHSPVIITSSSQMQQSTRRRKMITAFKCCTLNNNSITVFLQVFKGSCQWFTFFFL